MAEWRVAASTHAFPAAAAAVQACANTQFQEASAATAANIVTNQTETKVQR